MTASPTTTLGPSIELHIGGMTCAPPAVPRYWPCSNSAARGGPVADARLKEASDAIARLVRS